MDFNQKQVIVVGLAKSGLSAVKVLHEIGAKVTVTDIKAKESLMDILDEMTPYIVDAIVGRHPEDLTKFEIAVLSPGVPTDLPFIQKMKDLGISVIGEIELAYQLCKGSFVGITGTNGKTTTTALTGEIFAHSNKPYYVVGNIGLPAVSKALDATKETTMVTEISSFQLETVSEFRAKVAAVLNLTPDHLNRHKTMENYIAAKARIFENQHATDALVLNYDDKPTRDLAKLSKGKVHYFSREKVEGMSAYIQDQHIVLDCFGEKEPLCRLDELFIFGRHNEENALAAALICRLAGIKPNEIVQGLKSFKGVEHRIEYTATIDNRIFYNDSKGTNPDSTICAIEAMVRPTILIAGGYNKDSDFAPIFDVFKGKVKSLILMGETKEIFAETAKSKGFNQIYFAENMEEAVSLSYAQSEQGDAILLSPACASWDMYQNFEQRGEHFKKCVKNLIKG